MINYYDYLYLENHTNTMSGIGRTVKTALD